MWIAAFVQSTHYEPSKIIDTDVCFGTYRLWMLTCLSQLLVKLGSEQHPSNDNQDFACLKIGTVEQASPYIIDFATGLMSRVSSI